MDDDFSDCEQLSVWQAILDEVMAGRLTGHRCPFCEDATIVAQAIDEYFISVRCTSCGRWIEGQVR
jgi:ribosomal protein S27E